MKYILFVWNRIQILLILKDLLKFNRSGRGQKRFQMRLQDIWPFPFDATGTTQFDRHYVYHPGWAARILAKHRPVEHVDISSTVYFVSIASAFIPMKFYDFRPAEIYLKNLQCLGANLTSLPFDSNSIQSLSCMHVVEHVGLGRYGDPIDYNGDLLAMKELSRVLKPGGKLLFAVPLGGISRIQFNAHRVYTKQSVINVFQENGLHLEEFSLIPDSAKDGGLIDDPPAELLRKQRYGCGCFVFSKAESSTGALG
jgi:SAM-dependent methyltransferase